MGKPGKTKTPVDLKISLNSQLNSSSQSSLWKISFTAGWSIAAADHGGGQKLLWQKSGLKDQPKWGSRKATTVKLPVSQTEKTFLELGFTSLYPNTKDGKFRDKLTWVHVEVIGKRKTWTEKKVKHTYNWSTPAARTLHIIEPPDPEFADDVAAGESAFSKKFTWSVPASSTWIGRDLIDKKKKKQKKKKAKGRKRFKAVTYASDEELAEIFYDTYWQSILVNNNTKAKNFDFEDDKYWKSSAAGWRSGATTPGQESNNFVTITESNTTSWTGEYSYTRYIRVKSRGPGGDSDWDYQSFTYYNAPAPAAPKSAEMDADGSVTIKDSGVKDSATYPSKCISYQYLTDVPETSITTDTSGKHIVTISPPSGSTAWTEAIRVPAGTSVTFPVGKPVDDKLTWTRKVFIGKDDSQREGEAKQTEIKSPAPLKLPTGIQISDVEVSTKRMTVSATNNSTVPSSFLLVYCRNDIGKTAKIGLIPHGESGGVAVQLPDEYAIDKTDIGVQAVLGDYSFDSGSKIYTVEPVYMQSEIVWDGGTLPKPASNLKLDLTNTMGTIVATWNWDWAQSNVAEISWAEEEEAWESTSQPSTYTITNTHTGKWYISGLSVGTWYVRVRLGRATNDGTTWSTYATTDPIKVVSVPDRPYLIITPNVITPDKEVTLSWVYSSEDGAPLERVYIAREGYLDDNPIVSTNQSTITLSQSDFTAHGWTWASNTPISLQVCTESEEHKRSEWSRVTEDSKFVIAPLPIQPQVTFDSGWNPAKQITTDTVTKTEKCLVSLPFIFTLSGFDNGNRITAKILRKAEDTILKPDEDEYAVYADDVVYLNTELTEPGTIEINREDLIGSLDDRAYYKLVISNHDQYGQEPQDGDVEIEFRVDWDHKAIEPEAEITVDRDNDVSFIKVPQPTGYLEGDMCDVYRLSVDKPVLIIENADFNTWYVDEYPTIGEFGGYKVVYKTFNGDIRTGDGTYAYEDYEGEDYSLTDFMSIIDFGQDSVTLRYNLSLSNSWSKDFTETKYLGGAIQGDWNPAVSRTGSLRATVSIQEDPMTDDPEETVEAMRRLAVYAGMCHIRTPDGSNYYANIDVQEDREEKQVLTLAKFSLNITKVDPPDVKYIMRTKEEWEEDQE